MIETILIFSWILCVAVTRLLSLQLQKIIGDTMFNYYLIPYGVLFFISSPLVIAIEYTLGEQVVFNIKQLSDLRAEELANIKAMREQALAEMMNDDLFTQETEK